MTVNFFQVGGFTATAEASRDASVVTFRIENSRRFSLFVVWTQLKYMEWIRSVEI